MDWSKAKNILIVLFLALNLSLAAYMFMSHEGDGTKKNIANTLKVLDNRGYTLKTDVPTQSKAYKLNYENVEYDRIAISQQLLKEPQISSSEIKDNDTLRAGSKSLVFDSKNSFAYSDYDPRDSVLISEATKVEEYVRDILSGLKLPASKLYLDSYKRNEDQSVTMVFIEKYKGYPIFSNSAVVSVTSKGIRELKCRFVRVKGLSSSRIPVVPAYQILLKFFVSGENKVITDIDLGYESLNENTTMESFVNPVWRIRLEDGTTNYYTSSGEQKQ